MKLIEANNIITVTLSKRNLLELLAKLSGYPLGSACTIARKFGERTLMVTAEANAAHYGSATPGPMVEETEKAIKRAAENEAAFQTCLKALFRGGKGRD